MGEFPAQVPFAILRETYYSHTCMASLKRQGACGVTSMGIWVYVYACRTVLIYHPYNKQPR
jgi:hypothetical protein